MALHTMNAAEKKAALDTKFIAAEEAAKDKWISCLRRIEEEFTQLRVEFFPCVDDVKQLGRVVGTSHH
jgi:hypothetical protein